MQEGLNVLSDGIASVVRLKIAKNLHTDIDVKSEISVRLEPLNNLLIFNDSVDFRAKPLS